MRRIGTRMLVAPVLAAAFSVAAPPCHADRTPPAGSLDWFRNDPPPGAPVPANPVQPSTAITASGAVAAADPGTAAPPAVAPDPAPAQQANRPNPRPGYALPPIPGMYPPAPQSSYGQGFGPSDYPSSQIYNYVLANARYATATALFRRAENDLSIAYRESDRRFEHSKSWSAALTAEQEAYRKLNDIRNRAMESIVNSDRYQHLIALKNDLADRIEGGRSRHDLSSDELLALARLKLKYATEMRGMEADALNAEPGVKQAQDELVTHGSEVAALRQKHADEVRADPEILVARRNLEDAKISRITAEAFLHGTMVSGDVALNAYYYARTPFQGYYPTNVYDGFGYGGVYGGRATNVRY